MRVLTIALAVALAGATAHAETYPDKPIHIVVPFSPGSATDVTTRAIAQTLSEKLGQPVVIDNRPGAGGSIGAAQVARAAPDGYTLLVHSSGHTVNPSIFANLGYDTQKDFAGISMLAELPNVLVVPPSKGWKTPRDLVEAAKAEPGKLSYGSAGTGSGTHMNAEKFRLRAGFDAVHVPYKGPPEGLHRHHGRPHRLHVRAHRLGDQPDQGWPRDVAIAVGSAKRSSVLPDVPTTEEAGYPGSAYRFWVGMLTPSGTPPAVIERLNKEVTRGPGLARDQAAPGRARCRRRPHGAGRLRQADRPRAGRECRLGQGSRHQAAMKESVMAEALLQTTVVGSYPQPDWLVNRDDAEQGRAAHAPEGDLARARAVPAAGAGRRHPARHPRHGAGRPRHHHRRRDAARELLQPLRHRARGHRPRASGRVVTARSGKTAGAAGRRQDPAHPARRGARHAVPARQHDQARQDHPARPLHHGPAGARTTSTRTPRRCAWTTPPR